MKIQKLLTCLVLIYAMIFVVPLSTQAQSKSVYQKAPTTTAMRIDTTGAGARTSISVQNVGTVNVAIGNASTVTYSTAGTAGYTVAVNQQIVCVGDTDAVYAIAASGTADLRIIETFTGGGARPNIAPSCTVSRLNTTGITNAAAANTIPMSDGTNVVAGNVIYKMLTTAITPNSTTCTDASGSLAITSNATGLGVVFRCDGTNYQLLSTYADDNSNGSLGTIATTGNTDEYLLAPYAATLTGVDFSGVDALSASDTNYITFSITNLGQAGAGSTALLAATAANTTQATGGTAISANTKRSLTLHSTAANLIVAKGDRLRIRVAVTGTLANTVTFSRVNFYLTRLS